MSSSVVTFRPESDVRSLLVLGVQAMGDNVSWIINEAIRIGIPLLASKIQAERSVALNVLTKSVGPALDLGFSSPSSSALKQQAETAVAQAVADTLRKPAAPSTAFPAHVPAPAVLNDAGGRTAAPPPAHPRSPRGHHKSRSH